MFLQIIYYLKFFTWGDVLRKTIAIFLSLSLILLFSGCKSYKSDEPQIRLTTSFYPVYIMTINITKGVRGVEVFNIADQNIGCLHDFQLQAEDMVYIEKSDAFIINGAGMESFLDKVIDNQSNTLIIDSSDGIKLIEDSSNDDDDGEFNSHTWVSISNYIKQVENIYEGIITVDPKNREIYRKNMLEYMERLEKLKTKMHMHIDRLPNRDIITFHEAFPYFADEFNLNVVDVINREPNSQPNAKELIDTIRLVESTNVRALFVEPQYPKTTADIVAKETGAKVYTLDPCVSGNLKYDSYIEAMEKNLEVLKEALK